MKSPFYCCVRRYRNRERKTLYHISDFMFRFWYRYDSPNKTLLETDAQEIVWKRRIEPVDFSVLQKLKERADVFTQRRERTWFVLFSKSGFSEALRKEAEKSEEVILVEVRDIICRAGLTIFGGIMGVHCRL